MKNTDLGAKSKIYPDNPSNSSNMERDQNDSFNLPIIMEYNMMFVDNKKLQSHWVSLKRLLVNKLSET